MNKEQDELITIQITPALKRFSFHSVLSVLSVAYEAELRL